MIEIPIRLNIYCKVCGKSMDNNIEYRTPLGKDQLSIVPCKCSNKKDTGSEKEKLIKMRLHIK